MDENEFNRESEGKTFDVEGDGRGKGGNCEMTRTT